MFGYSRVPTTDLPSTISNPPDSNRGLRLGRARLRWILIVFSFLALLLFIAVLNSHDEGTALNRLHGSYLDRVWPYGKPSSPNTYTGLQGGKDHIGQAAGQMGSATTWVNGSGRQDLSYSTPFNQDDLTLTADECDAFFPGLYKEVDRSVEWFTEHPFTKEYLEHSCDDGIFVHARVVIYHNRLYLKQYTKSEFSRSDAALALLHLAIATSRERLPNVEFCINLQDWGSRGKFSLSRAPEMKDVWLMPDYGFFSWPEHVGSYQELRENTERVEKEIGWERKHNKLFWRGSMDVGKADREAMMAMSTGQEWSDVKPLNWANTAGDWVSMEDHCRWKFHGFPEGNTYSGRLRYIQNCRSVIVTHEPRWLQHWTHLYNADWNSPDQNIVFVPPAIGPGEGVLVHYGDKEGRDRTWERLPETMDRLLNDDALAKKIADNQWQFFRERYISPASAACYWRKAIRGFAEVQRFEVSLSGQETSYESFMLLGMRTPGTRHHRRDETSSKTSHFDPESTWNFTTNSVN